MEVRRLPQGINTSYDLELYHHGIKGQRWGVRRYQNADGSLTAEGRKHYDIGSTAIKGAKIGAAVGAGVNGGIMAAALIALAATGVGTVPALAAAGSIATQAALGAIGGTQIGLLGGVGVGALRQSEAKKKGIKLGDLDPDERSKAFDEKWNTNKQEREWQEKYNKAEKKNRS